MAAIEPGTARVAGSVTLAALAALAVSIAWADKGSFPFPWAVAPVVATAVLLALITGRDEPALPRWVMAPGIVWVGKISYSFYLWHWPVFVLCRWTVGIERPAVQALALVTSLGLAAASYRWVERPVRHARPARAGSSCLAIRTPRRTWACCAPTSNGLGKRST